MIVSFVLCVCLSACMWLIFHAGGHTSIQSSSHHLVRGPQHYSFMKVSLSLSLSSAQTLCLTHRKNCFRYLLTLIIYLNLAEHLPITSPWHTSSALNSDPSSVR